MLRHFVVFTLAFAFFLESSQAFLPSQLTSAAPFGFAPFMMSFSKESNNGSDDTSDTAIHPSLLPGDPSLVLVTNVDLADKKLDIMKECSKAICQHTGKPESYIAVSITDKASVIFGGSDAPAALACLYSIGSIAMASNGAITNSVTDLLEPYGVPPDRIYINFFDMPRSNVGWNRKTFAG